MEIFRTAALLGLLTGIMLLIGYAMGGQDGMLYALAFAAIFNFGAYWFSDKIVLAMYSAKPSQNEKLNKIVEKVAKNAGIPMPKVYIVQSPIANAFATGRSTKNAAVAATTGILQVLNNEELEAVFSHEIAHVKNRDTLVSAMAATIGGAISFLANMAYFAAFNRDNNRSNAVILLPLVFLAPIAAMLVRLAISRSREYGADHTGAYISRKPLALPSALEKISAVAQRMPLRGNPATSHLWIVNPFKADIMMSLFSTHPPLEERIKRLKELSGQIR